MRASFLLLLMIWAGAAHAQEADMAIESLSPAQARQAHALWGELRCVVCQGQSVAESRAPLAADMRGMVVARLKAGDRPEQIRAYLVARYGDHILLRPPVKPSTWPLWGAPLAFLLIGAAAMRRTLRRRRS